SPQHVAGAVADCIRRASVRDHGVQVAGVQSARGRAMNAPTPANQKRMARIAAIVAGVVVGMTGMAFAAVPLYDAFCKITGYGGTTQEAQSAPAQALDRRIEVRFDANVAPGL